MKLLLVILGSALLLPAAAAYSQQGQTLSNAHQSYIEGYDTANPPSLPNTTAPGGQRPTEPPAQTLGQNPGGGNQQVVEGCIVRRQTAYYIQPVNGPAMRLRGNQSFRGLENHSARVYGQPEPPAGAYANQAGQTGAIASTPDAGDQAQDFLVTRVQSLSATCPAGDGGGR